VARWLREVVVILLPSLNPDGHAIAVDWYQKGKGTEFEGANLPALDHKYAGHDINRDAFMMNLAESRSIADFFYRHWHPQVFLTMHQMGPRGPRFFVPPNTDPIDRNYDPLVWRTAGLLGNAMALTLEQDGRAGVLQNALYDYYWPGYEDSAPLGRNTVTLLTKRRAFASPRRSRSPPISSAAAAAFPITSRRRHFPTPGRAATGSSATSSTTTCPPHAGSSAPPPATATTSCATSIAWQSARSISAPRADRLRSSSRRTNSMRMRRASSSNSSSTATSSCGARWSRSASRRRSPRRRHHRDGAANQRM
jgi:hypothetical protein